MNPILTAIWVILWPPISLFLSLIYSEKIRDIYQNYLGPGRYFRKAIGFNTRYPTTLIVARSATFGEIGIDFPATGIGQVEAIRYLLPDLTKYYSGMTLNLVFGDEMSEEDRNEYLKQNLLLIGGPKHNKFTEYIMTYSEILKSLPYNFGYCISDYVNKDVNSNYIYDRTFELKYKPSRSNKIEYAMIINIPTIPTNKYYHLKNRIIIVAGTHTEGVGLAAEYMTKDKSREIEEAFVIAYKDKERDKRFFEKLTSRNSIGYQVIIKAKLKVDGVLDKESKPEIVSVNKFEINWDE